MKNFGLLPVAFLFLSATISAQVGVNTTAPNSTMDVSAKRDSSGNITDNTQIFGLQAPRLTRAELTANTATYGANQQGALIYITDISGGTAAGQRINIDAVGYYSFDGSLWQKIKVTDTNIYTNNGTLTSNRTLTNGGRSLTFLGSDQYTQWSSQGYLYQLGLASSSVGSASMAVIAADKNSNGFNSRMDIQAFPEAEGQILAVGDATALSLGTSATQASAPIKFSTSTGSNALGTEKMRITGEGNVGIGTTSPSVKLDINTGGTAAAPVSGFKLVDGNQKDNFVLTSDNNGLATWKSVSVPITRLTLSGSYTLPANTGVSKYTGVSITLPPGMWAVNLTIGMNLNAESAYTTGTNFVRFRLEDNTIDHGVSSSASDYSADAIYPRLASTGFGLSETLGTLNGVLAINNTSGGSKTYYLFVDNAAGKRNQVVLQFGWNETFISYYAITN